MTNWFHTRVPRHLAPTLDVRQLCMCRASAPPPRRAPPDHPCIPPFAVRDGVFRTDLSLREFPRLFYLDKPQLLFWIPFP
jgi:hypothetical protein